MFVASHREGHASRGLGLKRKRSWEVLDSKLCARGPHPPFRPPSLADRRDAESLEVTLLAEARATSLGPTTSPCPSLGEQEKIEIKKARSASKNTTRLYQTFPKGVFKSTSVGQWWQGVRRRRRVGGRARVLRLGEVFRRRREPPVVAGLNSTLFGGEFGDKPILSELCVRKQEHDFKGRNFWAPPPPPRGHGWELVGEVVPSREGQPPDSFGVHE